MGWAAFETSFLLWPINEPTGASSATMSRHVSAMKPQSYLPLRPRLSWQLSGRWDGGTCHHPQAQADGRSSQTLAVLTLFLKLMNRSLLGAGISPPCRVRNMCSVSWLCVAVTDSGPHCGASLMSSSPPLPLMSSFPAREQMEAKE